MKRYVYYLATTLTLANGNQTRHYFIDTNKRTLEKVKNKVGGIDPHIDTVWRDRGNKATRAQITTTPFPHFSDPKNLLAWD